MVRRFVPWAYWYIEITMLKLLKVKVLKVKFQNLGENGAESHFTWEPRSGSFVPMNR
jgi:hypothetical protein